MNRQASVEKAPVNQETPISALEAELTPIDSFYVRSHFQTPRIDPNDWRLDVGIDGKLNKTFSLDDLKKMPQKTLSATLECAGNSRKLFGEQVEGEIPWGEGAIGTAIWSGVSLMHILRNECALDFDSKSTGKIAFEGSDGTNHAPLGKPDKFVRYLSFEKASSEDLIVALEMNDQELTPDHGFPARLIVPGWYGMASVKWLSKISVVSDDFETYFNDVKYVYRWKGKGPKPVTLMCVKSLITRPSDGEDVPLGKPLSISGKAWSGSGKIVRVELDDGTNVWTDASLGKDLGKFAWTSWKKEWTPSKRGRVVISCRATDSEGNTQPSVAERNDFLYGYNGASRISLNVV
jgi:DMSO/TMAO reductase YedYZ molybdopterin-dependent catalytic subunit